jgi:hypothetical protein
MARTSSTVAVAADRAGDRLMSNKAAMADLAARAIYTLRLEAIADYLTWSFS